MILARMLGLEGWVDCDIFILVGEENESFFIRVWKPLLGMHILIKQNP